MRCSATVIPPAAARGYADAMGTLYARNPEDPDVASFYALALLGTMSRSLIGYVDSHEGHSASLAGSETQRRVAEILERVLSAHPQHPGALHYLLHTYDDPAHARLALPAARTYATVAPESSHARHMPAHIFVQLGMWQEAAATDRAAFAASDTWVKAQGPGNGPAQLPRAVVASVRVAAAGTIPRGVGDARRDRADGQGDRRPGPAERAVVDARSLCRRDAPLGCARAASATSATSTNCTPSASAPRARATRPSPSSRARGWRPGPSREQEGDLRPAIAIMERQVAALIELAAGRGEQAVEILEAATDAELQAAAATRACPRRSSRRRSCSEKS